MLFLLSLPSFRSLLPTALFTLKSEKIKAKTKFEKSSMNAKSLLMLCNQLRGRLQEIIGIKN